MATHSIAYHVKEHISRRTVIYGLILCLYVIGIGAGGYAAFSIGPDDQTQLSAVVQQFVQSMKEDRAPTVISWQEIGIKVLKEVGVPWVLGLTIILAPVVLALLFLHGYSLGFSAGFLIHDLSLQGLVIGFLSIIPHQIFLIAGHFVVAGASLSFAYGAAKVLMGSKDENPVFFHLLRSMLLTVIGGAFILIGTWVQHYVTPVLVRLGAGLVA